MFANTDTNGTRQTARGVGRLTTGDPVGYHQGKFGTRLGSHQGRHRESARLDGREIQAGLGKDHGNRLRRHAMEQGRIQPGLEGDQDRRRQGAGWVKHETAREDAAASGNQAADSAP